MLDFLGESPWALFVSALVSSTLLPGGSEALLVLQLDSAIYPVWLLLLAATSGNVLGLMITFAMGSWIAKRYPLKALHKPHQQRAKRWLTQYGPLALLFAWLPLIGDPLCLLSGWLRMNFWLCMMLILAGKGARYLVLALGVSQL